jgi:beta-glucuronidase
VGSILTRNGVGGDPYPFHALRRLLLASLLLVAAAAPAHAQTVSTPTPGQLYDDGHTSRYLVDGPWEFRSGDFGAWTTVTVPYAWNAGDDSPASMRGGVGWFRKDFRVPRAPKGSSWILRFESVNYRATVYLNGHAVAKHEGGYIPFEVDLRKLRKGVNHLLVRVDSRRNLETLPPLKTLSNGLPSGGWWNYGGILREVYLRRVYKVDLDNLLVRPTLPCRTCAATVLVQATLHNLTGARQVARVRANVGSASVRFPNVTLAPHAYRSVATKVGIAHPRLWWPGDGQLYHVSAAAFVRRRAAAGWIDDVGVRSIRVSRQGRLLINGTPVTLRGASFHEEDAQTGAALTPEMRQSIWDALLGLGATMTRAHYPLHPWFLEQADRDGIFVWDEIPMYQTPNSITNKRAVRAKALRYLTATVARDQNHPSVLTWSVGNEMPTRVGTGQQRYIRDAAHLLHRLDPTRLRALDYSGYPNAIPSSTYHVLDALGINCYFGWYPGPGGQLDDRAALGPFLDLVHSYYPTKALFVTEFGAEANRDGPIDEKGTYSFQRKLIEDHLAVYNSKPFVNGALIWALRDFRVRPNWDGGNPKPQSPFNQKGLEDTSGKQKPAYLSAARIFHDTPPLAVSARR